VREFKVLTGTYGAEYGRQAGGQVVVTTKSGTNGFHGSAFEFHRNSALNARNFFAPTKPSFRRNQFGGVIGGPIRKDRTFCFGGYEGQRRGQQEAGLANVPTLEMRQGDFTAVPNLFLRDPLKAGACNATDQTACFRDERGILNRIPQDRRTAVGMGLLALYPNPNVAGANNFASAGTGRFGIDQWSVRIDHKLRENMNLFGSYQYADGGEFFPITNPLCSARAVPGFGCDELQRTQHFTLNWTWTITPR